VTGVLLIAGGLLRISAAMLIAALLLITALLIAGRLLITTLALLPGNRRRGWRSRGGIFGAWVDQRYFGIGGLGRRLDRLLQDIFQEAKHFIPHRVVISGLTLCFVLFARDSAMLIVSLGL